MLFIKLPERFKKLPIRTKLIIFMTFLLVLTSLVNLYFFYESYIAMDDYNEMLQDYSQVNKLSIRLNQGRECLSRYITTKDQNDLTQFLEYSRQVDRLAGGLVDQATSLEAYLWSKAVKNCLESYDMEASRALNLEPGSDAFSRQFAKMRSIYFYLEGYIKQLLDIKLTEGEWYHQKLVKRAQLLRWVNLASLTGITVFGLVFVLFLSRSITEPLKQLTRFSMNIAKGNFNTERLQVDSSEDINILAYAFNKMAQSIQSMIQEITEKSDVERKLHEEEYKNLKFAEQLNEAKFLALQSQINPHFLFNTLNAIMRTSMFERAQKTTGLIEALSRIFRYNLGGVQKEVLLQEELAIIKEYLNIQQTRFGERIKFSLVCRGQIDNLLIPRFTIQPLVENAIIHGLEPKESGGEVRIKIYQYPDRVVLKIIDTGIGIPRDRVADILNGAVSENQFKGHTTGIGINNVRERIILYSKDEHCFKLRSKLGLGTVITIKIAVNVEVRGCINC